MSTVSFTEAADRIRDTIDIIDVVSRHVVLKRQGKNHVGLCPFHNDKSPSMNVSPTKGIFKCFSCGEGGDALAFLMKLERKTFPEVIRELAEAQGIIIVEEGRSPEAADQKRDLNQKILAINESAQRWFVGQLNQPSGDGARGYLSRRSIGPETMARFGLGYAPPGWENLTQHILSTTDFVQKNPDLLVTCGIANSRREGHGYYDRFRNRLMVPIHDDAGRVVGFGGRALINRETGEEEQPKYLNSPETALYNKSKVLYGLFQAKDTIRQTQSAVVMEGYFDVISAHMGGVTQAVGSCGTALTDGHLKLLSRYGAETLYLAFDSDAAGQKAALNAIDLIEPYLKTHPLRIKIVLVTGGKDPDEFIRANGGEAFQRLMDAAMDHTSFRLQQAMSGLDVKTADGRVKAAEAVVPILAKIGSTVAQWEHLQATAERIGIRPDDLSLELKRYVRQSQPYKNRFQRDVYPNHSRFAKNNTSGSKSGAIFSGARRSLRGTHQDTVETLSTLHKQAPSPLIVAERALFKLFFLTPAGLGIVLPLVHRIELADNRLDALAQLLARFASGEDTQTTDTASESDLGQVGKNSEPLFVEALADKPLEQTIHWLNNRLADQPDIQRVLTDLVFEAEVFAEQIQLDRLSPSEQQEWIRAEAQKYLASIALIRRQSQAKTLVRQLNTTPNAEPEGLAKELETQYQIRQQLMAYRPEAEPL